MKPKINWTDEIGARCLVLAVMVVFAWVASQGGGWFHGPWPTWAIVAAECFMAVNLIKP